MDVKTVIAVIIFLIIVLKARLIGKILDYLCASSYYKKSFVNTIQEMTKGSNKPDSPLYGLKSKQYSEIEEHLKNLPGDALEIGGGVGASLYFLRLPKGCSLVVVDYNPHFEKPYRERLANFPDINLKDYLVQSAVDMSNIPDNSFSVVFVTDVLCSIDETLLRKMLQEIKRVLKPDGRFYFLEHVIDKPGTWRRCLQQLLCWLNIWPRIGDGCHCNRETWKYIQETGFKSVTLSYSYVPSVKKRHMFDKVSVSLLMYIVKYFLHGHARK